MTQTDMLKALGACIGCASNPAAPGCDLCISCMAEEARLSALIGAQRAARARRESNVHHLFAALVSPFAPRRGVA